MDGIGTNPFEESDNDDEKLDYISDLHLHIGDSNEKLNNKSAAQDPNPEQVVTVDGIATHLITNRFLLTALEFHMELMESGHELPKLREFFSNPANFERARTVDSTKLTRTSSIQTFDSLDFARYSDDGERHENDRIAVLEFELRKAHEKINSLRSSLTKTAETDILMNNFKISTEELNNSDDSLLPYEKRAINFLINEYLLKCNYKLTSVTFSEENDGQDFDDWDDVGINTSKPPNLIKLFREGHYSPPMIKKKDFECMTSFPSSEQADFMKINSKMSNDIKALQNSIEILQKQLDLKAQENTELKLSIEDMKGTISSLSSNVESVVDCEPKDENHVDVKPCDDVPTILKASQPIKCLESDQLFVNVESKLSSFQNKLFEIINQKEDTYELSSSIPKCLSSLIEVLGDILPKIVPNVLIAKRDELIPLLINAAALHQSTVKRDELLSIIFNLIKRPNSEQRHFIKSGCIAFAQHVGPLQTEGELLPQCWEQISHKYPERRLLVAETCGGLSSYVFEQTRSSLLLSMLDQMSTDREEDVRDAVAKSLAVVVSFLEKDDKYDQVINLLCRLMADPSEKVTSTAKSILLPTLAKWSLDLKCLEKFLNLIVMEPIETSIYQVSNHFVVKDQKLFITNMINLHKLLPFIMYHLISPCYTRDKLKNSSQDDANQLMQSQRLLSTLCDDSSLNNIKIITSDNNFDVLIDHFYQTVTQEWFASWDELDWLTGELLPRLVDLSAKLEISQPSLHHFVALFSDICTILGNSFTKTFIKPKFEQFLIIPTDENSLDRALMSGLSTLNRSIVPIFVAGVFPSIPDNKDICANQEAMFGFLSELLRSLAIHQSVMISLHASITEMCSLHRPESLDVIIRLIWEFGVVHKNQLVKAATSQVIENLVSTCNLPAPMISGKIIPALVTLASDMEEHVRISTISPLGAILEHASNSLDPSITSTKAIMERVQVQLQAFMEENHCNEARLKSHQGNSVSPSGYLVSLEIIKVLGRLGPKVEMNFREEFVLPRLTALAVRNQLSNSGDIKSKQEAAIRLLDAFINISCCFLSHQVIQEVVLPGLKCLHHDIQQFAPDRVNIILSLMKEMEDKIDNNKMCNVKSNTSKIQEQSAAPQGHNPHAFLQADTAKQNILSRIKDVKDKATNSHFTKMFHMSRK